MQDDLFSSDPELEQSYRPVEQATAPKGSALWERTTVYTDGACRGTPGPGGWAWAIPGVRGRSGFDPRTTNQRMEVQAALDAMRSIAGPLQVVSDSTYVVNCVNNRWYVGWLRNGWRNSQKQPVANRELWEPFVAIITGDPGRVVFKWVKGHGRNAGNNLVDALAVEASHARRGWDGPLAP